MNKLLRGPLLNVLGNLLRTNTHAVRLGALSLTDVAEDQAVKPSHVFFTSSGRIGTIMDMADVTSLHMTALQRNMAKTLTGPGGDSHTQYVASSLLFLF